MVRTLSLLVALLAVLITPLHAQTDAQLRGGIVINEILADPNSSGGENFDTDGDGDAAGEDEFVELFNVSESSVDIGGLQILDEGSGNWYEIEDDVTLDELSFAVIVCGVQEDGSLPDVEPENEAFDAERGGGVMNNGGDNIVVYDPDAEEYIQAVYNGDEHFDRTDFDVLSASDTRVGSVDDFGSDTDGVSRVRKPSGRTTYEDHNEVNGENASPGQPGGIALPVELAAFQVTADDERVVLSWRTASETNNAGFTVEHRVGAADHWNDLDFVDGHGTTAQPRSYRFATEALGGGTHTFRLRQVDVDGTTHLGPERTVTLASGAGLALSGPHPLRTGQTSSATVSVEVAQPIEVALYNVLGQRVQTVVSRRVTPEQPAQAQVSTAELSSGVYFLRATGPSMNVTRRVVIAR